MKTPNYMIFNPIYYMLLPKQFMRNYLFRCTWQRYYQSLVWREISHLMQQYLLFEHRLILANVTKFCRLYFIGSGKRRYHVMYSQSIKSPWFSYKAITWISPRRSQAHEHHFKCVEVIIGESRGKNYIHLSIDSSDFKLTG